MENNNTNINNVVDQEASNLLENTDECAVYYKRFENDIDPQSNKAMIDDDDDDVDMVADNDDLPIPSEFLCPITLSLMEYPYMSRWGQNFEGRAIIDWIDGGHDTCPLTRRPMKLRDLLPNRQLSRKIKIWKIENGLSSTCPTDQDKNTKKNDNTDDEDCCFDYENSEDRCSNMPPYYMRISHRMTIEHIAQERLSRRSLSLSSSEVQSSSPATTSSNDSGEEDRAVAIHHYVARRAARIRQILSQIHVDQQQQQAEPSRSRSIECLLMTPVWDEPESL